METLFSWQCMNDAYGGGHAPTVNLLQLDILF